MTDTCPDCNGPMVCLAERIETEIRDLRDIVTLAVRQVAERYASIDVSGGLDWAEEAKRVPYDELRRRREPFTGVNP